MIISHLHKFIFVKTQKTAGTSVEIALSEICGDADIITPISPQDEETRASLGFRGAQNMIVPRGKYNLADYYLWLKKKQPLSYYNHLPARKIRQWIGKKRWNEYFKFSIERNPWDKVISHYHWKGGDERFGSMSQYLDSYVLKRVRGGLQYEIGNKVSVDQVYKFEDLSGMMNDLTNRFNLQKPLELPKKKAKAGVRKDARHYHDILTPAESDQIQEIFAKEIERFGYRY